MLKEAVPSMYIYESEMGTRIAVDGCRYRGQMQTGDINGYGYLEALKEVFINK